MMWGRVVRVLGWKSVRAPLCELLLYACADAPAAAAALADAPAHACHLPRTNLYRHVKSLMTSNDHKLRLFACPS